MVLVAKECECALLCACLQAHEAPFPSFPLPTDYARWPAAVRIKRHILVNEASGSQDRFGLKNEIVNRGLSTPECVAALWSLLDEGDELQLLDEFAEDGTPVQPPSSFADGKPMSGNAGHFHFDTWTQQLCCCTWVGYDVYSAGGKHADPSPRECLDTARVLERTDHVVTLTATTWTPVKL